MFYGLFFYDGWIVQEGIGKNVRNESIEPQPSSETAVEACPTAYKSTPRVRVVHSKKQTFFI